MPRDDTTGVAMPWRSWLTGSLAIVMLAACARSAQPTQHTRQTRLSTSETVARVVASAQSHGLAVVALIPMPARRAELLVLGPSREETAVIQHSTAVSEPRIDLPLTLEISRNEQGGAEVRFHDETMPGAHALSQELRDSVAALPALVDKALA